MDRLTVDDAVIDYRVHGHGAPVLLIPVGVVADGLGRPLLERPELAARYRLIHFTQNGRELLLAWFPQVEDPDVDTTHLLQMQDPDGVARGLAGFFERHPLS